MKPAAGILAVTALLLAGCGGGGGSTTTAASTTSRATQGATTAPMGAATGCAPPAASVTFKSGAATVNITAGPGAPQNYALSLDQTFDKNNFAADNKELHARWADQQGHVLDIDIEGSDPCSPDAFTSIKTGPSGPTFVDAVHKLCKVTLPSLSAQAASGTFSCSKLGGGGEGVTIDANGTFSLSV